MTPRRPEVASVAVAAAPAAAVGAVVYATGFGSALGVGFLLVLASSLRAGGWRTVHAAAIASVAAIAAGELAVATGLAPSLLDSRLAHAVALVTAVGLLVVARILRDAGRARERAMDAMRVSLVGLERQAVRDPLTDLPNTRAFVERTAELIDSARRPHEVAVVLADFDGFRHINDALGFAGGDSLLVEITQRLIRHGEGAACFGRVDGGRLAWLLPGSRADVVAFAERFRRCLHEPFVLFGETIYVTASFGIAFARPGEGPLSLLRCAHDALDLAKRRGGDRVECFAAPAQPAVTTTRLRTAAALHRALERGSLAVHYQPIVELASGNVVAAEALARWWASGVPVPPTVFVPLAEETGRIAALGEGVLAAAAGQAAAWGGLRVAVNVSARQLLDSRFADRVASLLYAAGLDPSQLVLELTETVLVEDSDLANRAVSQLVAMGVRLAIDDFGAGYAGLQYLRRYDVAEIKIDRVLIDHLDGNPERAALVRATIEMAHALGVEVVAEGVEREAERDLLATLGCRYAQGFLFGRPVPAMEFPIPEQLRTRAVLLDRDPAR